MTKTDLFRILLKLVGLYTILVLVINLIKNIGFLTTSGIDSDMLVWGILLFNLLGIAIMVFITLKPDGVINLLRLDKGFDNNKFDIQIDMTSIVSLIIILSAFYLFIDNIGLFINNIIFDLYSNKNGYSVGNKTSWFVYPAINLAIGGILIFYYHPIASYIVSKRNTETLDSTIDQK